MFDLIFKIGYYVLIAAVVALGCLLLISSVPTPLHIEVKIVESGSMEPAIHTGSLVVIKPRDSYQVGEIITFYFSLRDKIPTTHRIVEVQHVEGKTLYLTKGDANEESDPRSIPESSVVGRVFFSIPYLGYVLDFVKKPLGFALVIGVPAFLIIVDEAGKIWGEVRNAQVKEVKKDTTDV